MHSRFTPRAVNCESERRIPERQHGCDADRLDVYERHDDSVRTSSSGIDGELRNRASPDGTQAVANITIAPNARAGAVNVTVNNGVSRFMFSKVFTVQPAELTVSPNVPEPCVQPLPQCHPHGINVHQRYDRAIWKWFPGNYREFGNGSRTPVKPS